VGANQTVLAARLAPPGSPGVMWLVLLGLLSGGAMWMTLTSDVMVRARIMPWALLASSFFAFAWGNWLTKKARWRFGMADWQQRWICMACGTIWDPPDSRADADERTSPPAAGVLGILGALLALAVVVIWLHTAHTAGILTVPSLTRSAPSDATGTSVAPGAPARPTPAVAAPAPSPPATRRLQALRANQMPAVRAFRAALDSYREASDAGLDRPEVRKQLDEIPRAYLESRFVLLEADETPAGGMDLVLVFRDQRDRIFEAWMYERPDGWVLRAFRERQDLTEQLPGLLEPLADVLADSALSW
jgi:hypothetical protein